MKRESRLSQIEEVLLGGNCAHDLIELKREGSKWLMRLQSCSNCSEIRTFSFVNAELEYEEFIPVEDEELELPLPLIGANSWSTQDSNIFRYCFNFSDLEIAFTASPPVKQ